MNDCIARLKVVRAQADLWRYKLDKPVGGSGVACVDLVVTDIEASNGQTGLGFSYVLGGGAEEAVLAARRQLEQFVVGKPLRHPEALSRNIQHSMNRTGRGSGFIGMAAVDVAAWDLYARCLNISVGAAMGGESRKVPVYGSGGFYAGQSPESALAVAAQHRARGFRAIKLRVSGTLGDLSLIDAVASHMGTDMALMMDANEKCSSTTASRLLAAASEARTLFVEEPLKAHDMEGYARLKGCSASIATGEHLQGMAEWGPFIRQRLADVLQPDLAMMGGLSECLRLSRMAELQGIEIAPHFLPCVFVHLAAAMPNVTWLEDFPLLEPLFSGVPEYAKDGTLALSQGPGLGLQWAPGARQQCHVDF